MTLLKQADSFSRKIAYKAAEFQLKTVTKQAVKKLKGKNEEVTLGNVIQQFEGLDKLQCAGFDKKWINEVIEKELKKCT